MYQYTTSLPPVYHQYTTSIPPVYHKRLYRFGIRDFVFTWWCNESFFISSIKIALHCIAVHCLALHCIAVHCLALHCIALHYIVQSEAHFNLKLTALRSMRVQ